MSGANYHISYCQILESERRLKVSSILKLYQSSTEQISIHGSSVNSQNVQIVNQVLQMYHLKL